MWGTYFFLSDEMVEHQQTVRTILDCLSSVGGLLSLFLSAASKAFIIVNRKWMTAKLIRALYFKGPIKNKTESMVAKEKQKNEMDYKGIKYIKFNWKNKLAMFKSNRICK